MESKKRPIFGKLVCCLPCVVATILQATMLAADGRNEPPVSGLVVRNEDVRQSEMREEQIFLSPGVSIEILKGTQGEFIGLGRIEIDRATVRTGQRAMTVELMGREGNIAQGPFFLEGIDISPDHKFATLRTLCRAKKGEISLHWHLSGQEWQHGNIRGKGFSYRFRYRCEQTEIHQIVEESSWCLDGDVNGTVFLEQSEGYGRGSRAVFLDQDSLIAHQSPLPQKEVPETRQGVGDWLDTLLKNDCIFSRFVAEPALTYRDVWRDAVERELNTREEYVTPLANHFLTPSTTVLLWRLPEKKAARGDLSEAVSAWFAVRDAISQRLREKAKLEWQPPLPWVGIPSFDVADWTEDVDRHLDFYSRMGFKRLWKWSLWQTEWSEADTLTEEQKKQVKMLLSHAVMKLEWATRLPAEKIAELCRKAEARDMEVILWFPTAHLSLFSPLLKQNPHWLVRRKHGTPFNYVYDDLLGVFHPAGFGEYALRQLRARREEVRFHGLFFDSFQVFGNDIINYGTKDWQNQFNAILNFIRELQHEGLTVMVEGHTPFAIPASTGFLQNIETGAEFLLYKTNPHWGGRKVSAERYFRLLAFMAPPLLDEKEWWENEELQLLGANANRAYDLRLDRMHRCVLLPGSLRAEAGGEVLLSDDAPGVVWWDDSDTEATVFAFRDGEVDLGRSLDNVQEIETGERVPVQGGRFSASAYRIYLARASAS